MRSVTGVTYVPVDTITSRRSDIDGKLVIPDLQGFDNASDHAFVIDASGSFFLGHWSDYYRISQDMQMSFKSGGYLATPGNTFPARTYPALFTGKYNDVSTCPGQFIKLRDNGPFSGQFIWGEYELTGLRRADFQVVDNVIQGVIFRHSSGPEMKVGPSSIIYSPNDTTEYFTSSIAIPHQAHGWNPQTWTGSGSSATRSKNAGNHKYGSVGRYALKPLSERPIETDIKTVKVTDNGFKIFYTGYGLPESIAQNASYYSIPRVWSSYPEGGGYGAGGSEKRVMNNIVINSVTISERHHEYNNYVTAVELDINQTSFLDDDDRNGGQITLRAAAKNGVSALQLGTKNYFGWQYYGVVDISGVTFDADPRPEYTRNQRGMYTSEFWYTLHKKP